MNDLIAKLVPIVAVFNHNKIGLRATDVANSGSTLFIPPS